MALSLLPALFAVAPIPDHDQGYFLPGFEFRWHAALDNIFVSGNHYRPIKMQDRAIGAFNLGRWHYCDAALALRLFAGQAGDRGLGDDGGD